MSRGRRGRKSPSRRGNTVRPVTDARVVEALRAHAPRGLKPKEVARFLGVNGSAYRDLRDRMKAMGRGGRLLTIRGGRYVLPTADVERRVGVVSLIRSGAGFVALDRGGPDVFVPANALATAMHGDRVEVSIEPARPGRRASGTVERVVERNRDGIVGVVRGRPSGHRRPGARAATVETVGPGPSRTFLLGGSLGQDGEPEPADGDVVVVRPAPQRRPSEHARVDVVEVVGPDADPRTDSLRVIRQFGLPERFSDEVEAVAMSASGGPDVFAEQRVDYTHLDVYTIDPTDARDHDDGLSVEFLDDDRVEIGVHVADVASYVRPGSPIDREARKRGNSTYLVDRAVPMLPEQLSAEVCSLKGGTERRAVSLFFRVDGQKAPAATRLERTYVRPQPVLTYPRAQAILDGTADAPGPTLKALRKLRDLAEILRIRRANRGALDFDLPEAHVELNQAGRPIAIRPRLRLEAHRIVEEWMLAANEAIAQRSRSQGLSVLYRQHESPDPERLETLSALAAAHGYAVPRRWSARGLQQLLDDSRGTAEEPALHNAVLRSMKRAVYGQKAEAHFGLAVDPYLHFTSPIRRYADLHLHQSLAGTLLPQSPDVPAPTVEEATDDLARHTTDRERVSDQAGRESVDLARMRYLEDRIGDDFDGTIRRIVEWGFFVELEEAMAEGLVHVRSLDDHYHLHGATGVLVGQRRGATFRTGDRVRVRVARVDRIERQVDFELLTGPEGEAGRFDTPRGRHYPRPSDRNERHSDR